MLMSELGPPATGRARQRVLIIHQNFPGQFRHIAVHLHGRLDVEVFGLGRDSAPGLPDFPWFKYKLHREVKPEAHPYLRQMEAAVLHGQAVARAMNTLKQRGFIPDVILAHPGWGETLYAKEVFPQARLIHFCEWFYSTTGADFDFDPEFPPNLDDKLRITTWNALHLLNLENCDAAITPTHWQKSRHPEAYQSKIQVIHEGIDTANLGPDPQATLTLPLPSPAGASGEFRERGSRPAQPGSHAGLPVGRGAGAGGEGQLPRHSREEPAPGSNGGGNPATMNSSDDGQSTSDSHPSTDSGQAGSNPSGNPARLAPAQANTSLTLKAGDPIITYVARNLEPYRGFHTFMRALPEVLRQHPTAQVLIVGGDGRSYGSLPKDAPNWREKMLRELGPALGENTTRLHFLGKVPYATYKKILQVSAVHVYLTYPFVLSWSMLEAMGSACLLLASDTAPVRELITHGHNGILLDCFDIPELANKMLSALMQPAQYAALRANARHSVQAYSETQGVAAYLSLLGLAPHTGEIQANPSNQPVPASLALVTP